MPRRSRLIAPLLVAGAFGMAIAGCIGGELGSTGQEAKLELDVHLTPEAPVAVRHLTAESTAVAEPLEAIVTILATRPRDDGVYELPDGVTVSLRPDDATTFGIARLADVALPGGALPFVRSCREGCRGGVTAIVRGPSGVATDLRLISALRIVARSNSQRSLNLTMGLTEDVDRRIDVSPVRRSASAATSVVLRDGSPNAEVEVNLHADADLVAAARAGQFVGSLTIRAAGDAPTHDSLRSLSQRNMAFVRFGSFGSSLGSEGSPLDVDWLVLCPDHGTCDVPLAMGFSYDSLASMSRSISNVPSPPSVPAQFKLEIQATAALERFDGADLPSGALTVTARVKPR